MPVLLVNGQRCEVKGGPARLLLDVLREDLALTGTREGCRAGECGACHVLVDGRALPSCQTPLWAAEGREVTTVEALPVELHEAFEAEQAAQCGYCSAGMLAAAAALLRVEPDPTEPQIRAALERQLCRCGAHPRIVRAVWRAAWARAGKAGGAGRAGGTGGSGSAGNGRGLAVACAAAPGLASSPAHRQPALVAQAAAPAALPEPQDLPAAVRRHPRPAQWLQLDAEGLLEVRSGKVEIGQGIQRALARLVAEELGWPLERVRVSHPCTATHPDEGMTSGSLSVQDSGAALRVMAAALHERLCEAAAQRWGVPRARVALREGRLEGPSGLATDAAALLDAALLQAPVQAGMPAPPPVRPASRGVPADESRPPGLHPSLTRRAVFRGGPHFIHDMTLPGLLHGQVLHPPGIADHPLDTPLPDDMPRLAGHVAVWRDGALFGVLAERASQARAIAERLARAVQWQAAAPAPGAPGLDPHGWPALDLEPRTVGEHGTGAQAPVATRLEATYVKPWLAHASIGPSCALARWRAEDGTAPPVVPALEVWTHSQGIFPLRRDLALAFGLSEPEVVVHHRPGAGCYGHNGADDAAFDAAWLARRVPGRPVRVLWSREDDLARAPLGPAMLVRMRAALDAAGRIVGWTHELWSPGHSSRPGRAPVPALLGHGQREGGTPLPAPIDMPLAVGGGSDRNALPGYDLPAWRVVAHLVRAPWRSSALRALGATANVFAAESFVDEIAQATGRDPLSLRESLLGHDPRGLAVLRAAARHGGWKAPQVADDVAQSPAATPPAWSPPGACAPADAPDGPVPAAGAAAGRGLGYARYKGTGAWCAVLAQVEVAEVLRVSRLVVAADVGRVVDAVGVVQQLEGGAIQAASWALREAVLPGEDARTPASGPGAVPMLTFTEVPEVEVVLLPSDSVPLGAGEAAVGPTVAAIANALAAALGVRVRELPFTPARIRAAIEAQA